MPAMPVERTRPPEVRPRTSTGDHGHEGQTDRTDGAGQ